METKKRKTAKRIVAIIESELEAAKYRGAYTTPQRRYNDGYIQALTNVLTQIKYSS